MAFIAPSASLPIESGPTGTPPSRLYHGERGAGADLAQRPHAALLMSGIADLLSSEACCSSTAWAEPHGGGEGGTGEGEGEEGALGRVHALPNDPDGSEVTGGAADSPECANPEGICVCAGPVGAADPRAGSA